MQRKYLLGLLFFFLIYISNIESYGQTFTNGIITFNVTQLNPCEGANNGSIFVEVISNSGVSDSVYLRIFGPPDLLPGDSVAVGSTYAFNDGSLPEGSYFIQVTDPAGSTVTTVPPITLVEVTSPLLISLDAGSPVNNTSCISPNGSINISVSGGSGAGYTYLWTADNGFTSTSEDISGLVGGTYTVEAFDVGTNCSETLVIGPLSDPSPTTFNITTSSPQDVCQGQSITLILNDSEIPPNPETVEYTILVNGNPIPSSTRIGDGDSLALTIPTGSFVDGDILTVQAHNNNCADVIMNGSVTANVIPLPVPNISGPSEVCANELGSLYSTDAGQSNYVWTVVGGAIVSGGTATDDNVTVDWGATGPGSVQVNYEDPNGCSASTSTSLSVTINSLPNPTITGDFDVCENESNVNYTTEAGQTNYVWIVTGGTIVSGGTATDDNVSVDWGAAGAGTVEVSYEDTNGCSPAATVVENVTINSLPTPTITGDFSVCESEAGVNYTTEAGQTNYVWTVTGGTIVSGGTATDNTVSVDWGAAGSGSVTVNYEDANGCGAASATAENITINTLPATPSLAGDTEICANPVGSTYTTDAGQTNYGWNVIGGTITGGGTVTDNTVTVDWGSTGPGSVEVNYEDANGCSAATSALLNVTINSLPTPTITGDFDVCENESNVNYTTEAGQTNYVWTVTGGTIVSGGTATDDNVSVDWGAAGAGTVEVSYEDTNGCSPAATVVENVTINSLPTPTITGDLSVCESEAGVNYTTEAGQTNYVWTVTGGTIVSGGTATDNTVSVDWGAAGSGSVTVNYEDANGCGAASATAENITINTLPATPSLAGDTEVCANAVGSTYTTDAGQTNYGWNVIGGTITGGGTVTDNTVTVDWGSTGPGSVEVNYEDANGCSAATSALLSVTINNLPNPTITGDFDVCENESNVNYTTEAGQTNYVWIVTGGTIVSGGTATDDNVSVDWGAAGAGTVEVSYEDTNGCSPAATVVENVTINSLPTPTITGDFSVCESEAGVSYTTEAGQTNYVWTVTGGTIVSGGTATDNTVSVDWGAAGSGSVTVNYEDANGCGAASATAENITINTLPATPSLTGDTEVCANAVGSTYTTDAGQTNYGWNVIGGTITGGGTVTDNTVTVDWGSTGPGSVEVNYEDANGCSAATSALLSVTINSLPTPTITGDFDVCENESNVNYTTEAGQTNYVWTVTGGTIVSGGTATDDNVSVDWGAAGAGTVEISYEDINGCSPAATVVENVTINSLPTPTITGDFSVCESEAGVSYTTEAGQTNYVWTVTGGTIVSGGTATDNTVSVDWGAAGSGSVTVNYEDANGCGAASATAENITINTLPATPSLAGDTEVCANAVGSTYTTDAGQTNYGWNVIGGTITGGGTVTDNTVTVDWGSTGPGSVEVNYEDANGCSAATSALLSVTINSLPTPTITGDFDVCENESNVNYTTEAGQTNYVWTVTGGTIVSGGTATDDNVSVDWGAAGAGTVEVSYEDTNGCSPAATVVENVTINAITGDPAVFGIETWIGYVYDDSSNPFPPFPDFDISKYQGFITSTEIDAFNALSSYDETSDVFDLNVDTGVMAGANICGSYPDDFSVSYKMSKTFTNGSYAFDIGGDDGIMFFIDGIQQTLNKFNVGDADPDANHSYTVYRSDSLCLNGSHNLEIRYFERGGESRISFDYFEITYLATLTNQTDPTTCGGNDGSIEITFNNVPDGTYTFDYVDGSGAPQQFTNVSVTSDVAVISGLSAGLYNDIILTLGACTSTTEVDVTLNDPVTHSVSLVSVTDPSTCGGTDGSIELAFVGVADGSYSLDYVDGSGSPQQFLNVTVTAGSATIPNLTSGDYNDITLTISGCTSADDVDASLSDPVTHSVSLVSVTDPSTCGGTDGSIELAFVGVADGSYSLDYVDGSGSPQQFLNVTVTAGSATIPNLTSGDYNDITLTISGCTSADDVDASLSDPVTHSVSLVSVTDPSTCGGTDGSIELAFVGVADGSYSLDYVDGSGSPQQFLNVTVTAGSATIPNLTSGDYNDITLTISGCTSADDVDASLSDPVTHSVSLVSVTDPSTCGGTDGSIELAFVGVADGSYSLDYVDGSGAPQQFLNVTVTAGSATIPNLTSGDYNDITLTISGCTSADDVDASLSDPVTHSVSLVSVTDPSTCGGTDGSIELAFVGVADGSYSLDYVDGSGSPQQFLNVTVTAGSATIPNLTSGDYNDITLTISGCTSADDVDASLSDPVTHSVSLVSVTDPSTCGGTDGSIELAFVGVADGSYSLDYVDGIGAPQQFLNVTVTAGSATIPNLASGDYNDITLTISGCTSADDVDASLSDPVTHSVSLVSVTDPSTCGGTDGSIELAFVGVADGSYSLDYVDGSGSPQQFLNVTVTAGSATIPNLTSGDYNDITLTISGCTSADDVDASLSDPVTHSVSLVSVTDPSTCGGTDGSIELAFVGVADGSYSLDYVDGSGSPQQFLNVTVTAGSATIPNLTSGDYNDITLTISGCTSADDVDASLSDPVTHSVSLVSVTDPSTCGGTDGSIELAFVGVADGSYSLDYVDGIGAPQQFLNVTVTAGSATIPNLASGDYNDITLTISGCTSADDVDASLSDPVTHSVSLVSVTDPSTCGGTDGSIELAFVGVADGSYSLDYVDGSGSPQQFLNVTVTAGSATIPNLTSGDYNDITLTISGCTSADDVDASLSDPVTHSVSLVSVTDPSTCGGTDGSIELAFVGVADGSYSLDYVDGSGSPQQFLNVTVTAGSATIPNLTSGDYNDITLTISGCTSADDVDASLSDPVTHSVSLVSVTDPSTCGGIDGSIELAFVGVADGSYSLDYVDGSGSPQQFLNVTVTAGSATIPNLTSGDYNDITLTISGCTSADDVDASLSDPVTHSVSLVSVTDPSTCGGIDGSIELAFVGVADGSYSLDYVDGSGAPQQFLNVTVTAGSATIPNLTSGDYNDITLTISGCTSADDVDASLSDAVTHSVSLVSVTDPSTCGGTDGSIELAFVGVADGSYSLDYVDGSGAPQQFLNVTVTAGSATIPNLTSGDYNDITLTISGCTSADDVDASLSDPVTHSVSLVSVTDPSTCGGIDGSIELAFVGVADGSYSLDYVDGSGSPQQFLNVTVTAGSATIPNLTSGDYNDITLTISGCTSADDVDASLSDAVTHSVSLVSVTDPSTCGGTDGSIELAFVGVADGSYSLDYVDGSGAPQQFLNVTVTAGSATIPNLTSGDYNDITLTISGCTSADDVDASLSDPVTHSVSLVSVTDPSTCGGTDGSIELAFVGVADGSYSLDYVDGSGSPQQFLNVTVTAGSATIPNLTSGDYNDITLTISGCTSADDVDASLSDPVTHSVSLVSVTDPSTCGGTDGSIELAFVGVADGSYSLDYVDGSGAPQQFLNVTVTAGSATIPNLTSGDYNDITLTISGCTSADDVDASLSDPVTHSVSLVSVTDPSTCGGTDGSIELAFVGVADGSYSLDYVDGSGTPQQFLNVTVTAGSATIPNLASGDYNDITLTISGCTSADDVDASLSDPVDFTLIIADKQDILTCGGNEGSIDLTVNGGSGNFTYSWIGPNSFTSTDEDLISLDQPGIYTVFVRDNVSGCSSGISVNISQPTGCGVSDCFVFSRNIDSITRPDCADDNGAVQLTIIGTTNTGLEVTFATGTGLGSYSVASPQNTISISESNLSEGIYGYTISDGAGNVCTTSFVELRTLTSVEAELVPGSEEHVSCFGGVGSVRLQNLANSSTGDYFYSFNPGEWFPLGGDRRVLGLPAGTTVISVGEEINDDCPMFIEVTLNNLNPQIEFTPVSHPVSDCENSDGFVTFDMSPTGGSNPTGDYRVALTPGIGSAAPSSDLDYEPVVLSDAITASTGTKNLSAGGYMLHVMDESGCVRSKEVVIGSPNQVMFDVEVFSPSCIGNGRNGILTFEVDNSIEVPGPYVLIITYGEDESEIFYQDNNYSGGEVLMDTLVNGTYNVTIDPSNNDFCPNKKTGQIDGGPDAVSFDYTIECNEDGTKNLLLTDIMGDDDQDYTLRVLDRGTNAVVATLQFTNTLDNEFRIESPLFLNFTEEYILIMEQGTSTCLMDYRHPDNLIVPATLTAFIGETTQSLPDRFTGSLQVFNFSGGLPGYYTQIELDSAAVPGQTFITNYEEVEVNDNFQYEKVYEDVPAGRYLVQVSDELGCVLELVARVPLNTDVFIPNVFTPNGDDSNEVFYIRNKPRDESVELVITNRWGNTVYQSDDYQNDWTGDETPDGIYFYKAKIAGELFTGWLEILRGQP
ncbi:gliding motility-associated C-terminal domain-containing protein [Fulvivirga ligni]|uniref:T9SS type B sorting domain-containing protein n=1 Tax=Fulvivirga ligni TaxID=2904246 RepID=UPI001F16A519|nr:gliding motility-associated C-terminal domain-containing protein [Fulvivirga ligni]UII20415.1 gliding motility-associated C-terminal domain-containing protein [Fulvivirga ligni]